MATHNILFVFIFLYFTNMKALNHVEFNKESYHIDCSIKENITLNSPYKNQLKILMGSLHSKNSTFFNTTIPGISKNDTLYALFMCRGDIDFHMCQQCKNGAVNQLSSLCPISKVGVIWYDICMLRYSNENFFSTINAKPFSFTCAYDTAVPTLVNSMSFVNSTLYKVANEAAEGTFIGGNKLRFATKEVRVSNPTTLFTLAQCTPDLTLNNCKSCLKNAIKDFPLYYCYGKDYAQIFYTSCFIGYSTYPFYLPIHDSPPNDLVPQTNEAIQDSRSSQDPVYLFHNCSPNFTDPISSKILTFLLSSLTSKAKAGRTSYIEQSLENGYAHFLCRGDLTAFYCAQCVKAAKNITYSKCGRASDGVVWFSHCVLRFSSQDISTDYYKFDEVSVPSYKQLNITKSSIKSTYAKAITVHLDKLRDDTANSARRYVTDTMKLNDLQTIYFLAQCMGDMSTTECGVCLVNLIYAYIPVDFLGSLGGTVLFSTCILRFELYQFYMEGDKAVLPGSGSLSPGDRGKRKTLLIVFSLLGLAMLLTICLCILVRRRRKSPLPPLCDDTTLREIFGDGYVSLQHLQFTWAEIEEATNRFSSENVIGKGGFGEVYKGVLHDGAVVAVKKMIGSRMSDDTQFTAEITTIGNLQHRNLVKLIGFAVNENEKALIYEFVENNTLQYFVSDPEAQSLTWPQRAKIIEGIAEGMKYIHHHLSRIFIIHRDLKPSNILIDENLNPKISDFGLAKVINENPGNTSSTSRNIDEFAIATTPCGTRGYMSAEAQLGLFSRKTDVYSFGLSAL